MSKRFKTALSAVSLVIGTAAMAMPAAAEQPRRDRTSQPRDVSTSATTSGSGGGGSVLLDGTADAAAANGGEVNTRVRGRTTDRRGMISSTATARDDDERSRSRSRTIVTPRGTVRTMTSDMYRQRGEKPVRSRTRTVTDPN